MMTSERPLATHWRARLQRWRVPLGFVTAVLVVLASQPSWQSLAWGAPLICLGLLIRAWASGHLRKNAELAVSGPYAHTRNPLYFGSFVLALGCAVSGGTWWLGGWLVIFFLAVYWPVMQAEAAHMQQLFGDTYAQWAGAVPLFWPRLTPYTSGQARAFELEQYLRHREYRALLGAVLVLSILVLKCWWRSH